MKTKNWILLIGLLLIASLAGSLFLLSPKEAATHAQIVSNGQILETLDLRINQSTTIKAPNGGSNVVTVKDGAIAVTEATCPDHHCMERGFCSSGTPIVCLPNRLVIEFLGQQEIDISVG